jgi:large subunit ribosomal protein L21e
MQRTGGYRRKTRSKLRKNIRTKGKIAIRNFFRSFDEGDMVNLVIEPGVQGGMCHPRFHGKTGIVTSKQGSCYYVKIKDGNKEKGVLVHPVHLKKA